LSATLCGILDFFRVRLCGFGGLLVLCAGIRVLLLMLQALPLCGAAPTFLCRRKEK
jgi:hypothetical protein